MGATENLKDIINRQKEVLRQLEAEYHAIVNSDIARENVELKVELGMLRTDYEKAKSNVLAFENENAGLKNALYEQIYNEKIKIVNTAAQKLDVYFKSSIEGERNRLTAIENAVKSRIAGITATLRRHNVDTADEIYDGLDKLSALLNEKITVARANAAHVSTPFSEAERLELESLKSEQITDEQVRKITRKNNFERFVGLNLLNAVGIFLIIIGVITASRYAYLQLPATLKGTMMFTFGAVMLIVGELMNRKKPNVFSLGVTAGGVGVLYVALATSYFGLNILDMYSAIVVCILITVITFLLSNRYNSQVIMTFALIGGYLPMYSIGSGTMIYYGAMIYFAALNLLALMVSFSRKWRVSSYIGLVLNIIGTGYICLHFGFGYSPTIIEKIIVILYVIFTFLIYTLIPIVGTYRTKARFRKADIVLLAINTFFSSLIMYGVFQVFKLEDFNGALAIIFAVTYLLLGRFIEKKFTRDARNMSALFYLTGLAFVVLIIPFQFGRTWLSLGWLIEGVLLTTYGILKNEKIIKRAGLIICGLCLAAFLEFDLTRHSLFKYKYSAITLGSLTILGAYMYKRMMADRFVKNYKYFVFVNLWLYTICIFVRLEKRLFSIYPDPMIYRIDYLIAMAAIVSTFLIAYTVSRIKLLSDLGTKIISIIIYTAGILWLYATNAAKSPINNLPDAPFGVTLVGTLVLIIVGLISVLAVRDIMKLIVTERKLGIEWYPLIISGYFMLILTQNLITQYNLSFSSAAISIIYVLTALAWIVFGFMRRYSFIRKFGLGLAILAVIKLFLIDLTRLTQQYQIVSYFTLGITLVAISFVYQYFSKRLELKEGAAIDAQDNN